MYAENSTIAIGTLKIMKGSKKGTVESPQNDQLIQMYMYIYILYIYLFIYIFIYVYILLFCSFLTVHTKLKACVLGKLLITTTMIPRYTNWCADNNINFYNTRYYNIYDIVLKTYCNQVCSFSVFP